MALVENFTTIVDTGAGLYPNLYNRIIELTMPALLLKQLLPEFPLIQGRTATFTREQGIGTSLGRAAAITQVGEGGEVLVDFTPFQYITSTPYKVALRERITRELIEDFYLPVIDQQLRRLARRMAYTIDKDVQTVLSAGAGNSVSATGVTYSYLGVGTNSFSLPGTIGVNDVTQAKSIIENYGLIADTLCINPLNANDLQRLPQFASQEIYGQSNYANGGIGYEYKGGQIMGLNLLVTPVVPVGEAYTISTGKNMSASLAPLGFFVIKRPLTVDVDFKKEYDSFDIVSTTRYSPVVTYGEAIYKSLGLRTS